MKSGPEEKLRDRNIERRKERGEEKVKMQKLKLNMKK